MSVSGLGDEPGDLFPELPPAKPPVCEHLWSSQHRPGHALYWVRQCMTCHEVDWDAIDAEVAGIVTEAIVAAERTRHEAPARGGAEPWNPGWDAGSPGGAQEAAS